MASVNIPGYFSVSRRDRNDGRQGGGIAPYAAERTRYMGHIDSIDAERSWHIIHADVGPILLGVWYRPPDAPDVHTSSLAAELQRLRIQRDGWDHRGGRHEYPSRSMAAVFEW